MVFVISGVGEGIEQQFVEVIGARRDPLPTLRIVVESDRQMKYNYTGDIEKLSPEDVKKFVDDYYLGKL